jgi:hypothetical protein
LLWFPGSRLGGAECVRLSRKRTIEIETIVSRFLIPLGKALGCLHNNSLSSFLERTSGRGSARTSGRTPTNSFVGEQVSPLESLTSLFQSQTPMSSLIGETVFLANETLAPTSQARWGPSSKKSMLMPAEHIACESPSPTSSEDVSLSAWHQCIHDNWESDAPAEPCWDLWRFATFRSAGASHSRSFEPIDELKSETSSETRGGAMGIMTKHEHHD